MNRSTQRRKSERGAGARKGGLRERLEALSRNLWWSWSTEGNAVWDRVVTALPASRDAAKTARLRSQPVRLIESLNASAWKQLEADRGFLALVRETEKRSKQALKATTPPADLDRKSPVAYFSMEFGLHESLPIYSGGLGILAGDHIKSASDIDVPLVGITYFYRHGYFSQSIDAKGEHVVSYPKNDPHAMGLLPVCDAKGREVRVAVELPGRVVTLRAWQLAVGRRTLYLLDADLPENSRADRSISHRLYDGDREMRIQQEVVLGIGGVRLLKALRIRPGVWHLNEGHTAFLTIERLREVLEKSTLELDEAIEVIASDTVFTTHTPVPAGNETFDLALAARYLAPHCDAAGVPLDEYLRLGLDEGPDGRPQLSLTVLAIHFSRFRNGVSALHGEVSRKMWSKLWPGFGGTETPISSVTNGIHVPTWVAPQYDRLYREYVGESWHADLPDAGIWSRVRKIPVEKLWAAKRELRAEMVAFVRERTAQKLRRWGKSEAAVTKATESLLDPDALTIGFARRFATYKRASLFFRDLRRAEKLLGSKSRPVQLIFAGKPHPADTEGQAVFQEIEKMTRLPRFAGRVVLIENYDTEVCRHLVRGVDVWLNNPRRPQEASGTSGQKVPVNCGLNLSILDGWWCEGYAKDTGFKFGKEDDYTDLDQQDRDDHADLMRVLEREVIPTYYDRDRRGLPRAWLRLVQSSLEKLTYRFSTSHMVLDYAENLYAPALENGKICRAEGHFVAKDLAAWRASVAAAWPLVHLREVNRVAADRVEASVFLGRVEIDRLACCDENGDLLPLDARAQSDGTVSLKISCSRETRSLRLFPTHEALVHPQELGLALSLELPKSTARKSTARKSTARKSTARKSTARKSTARKSTRGRSVGSARKKGRKARAAASK